MQKLLSITLITAILAIGCKGPFADTDYTKNVGNEQNLRQIEPLDLTKQSTEAKKLEEPESAEEPESTKESQDTPTPPESLDLTVEQCRAIAIANNLSLKVSLINPTIARQDITAAEARFESLFAIDVSYSKTDSPTVDLTSGVQTESGTILPSFKIPLRTGGTIDLSMPINRYDTDNTFNTAFNPSYTSDFNARISQPLLRDAGIYVNTYAIRVAKYNDQ